MRSLCDRDSAVISVISEPSSVKVKTVAELVNKLREEAGVI